MCCCLERFHFWCSVLGAVPTLAAGVFSREKPLHSRASVAMLPALTAKCAQMSPDRS